MSEKHEQKSEFVLEGQFLGFVDDTLGKIKYIRLLTISGDNVQIKLKKQLRPPAISLIPGEKIRVFGINTSNYYTGENKFKAYQIMPLNNDFKQLINLPKAKILVCQKSGCGKRGGKSFLWELQKILQERGLLEYVSIEYTGCQKRCSQAPNGILQLGNQQYNLTQPQAIASFLENYINAYPNN
jgi:hypothetical protein